MKNIPRHNSFGWMPSESLYLNHPDLFRDADATTLINIIIHTTFKFF